MTITKQSLVIKKKPYVIYNAPDPVSENDFLYKELYSYLDNSIVTERHEITEEVIHFEYEQNALKTLLDYFKKVYKTTPTERAQVNLSTYKKSNKLAHLQIFLMNLQTDAQMKGYNQTETKPIIDEWLKVFSHTISTAQFQITKTVYMPPMLPDPSKLSNMYIVDTSTEDTIVAAYLVYGVDDDDGSLHILEVGMHPNYRTQTLRTELLSKVIESHPHVSVYRLHGGQNNNTVGGLRGCQSILSTFKKYGFLLDSKPVDFQLCATYGGRNYNYNNQMVFTKQ